MVLPCLPVQCKHITNNFKHKQLCIFASTMHTKPFSLDEEGEGMTMSRDGEEKSIGRGKKQHFFEVNNKYRGR